MTAEVFAGGRHSFEITYFHLDTENRILFDLVSFMPVNIGRALSRGMESRYEGYFFSDVLRISIGYSYTDARKRDQSSPTDSTFNNQLVFVPKHLANIGASLHFEPVRVNIIHTIVSSRYTSADNVASLAPYRLTNVNVALSFPVGKINLFGKFEISNVFDYNYEVLPYYPMPKRSYRATVSVEY